LEYDPDSLTYLKVIPSFTCSRGCHYCYNVKLGQETEMDAAATRVAMQRVLAAATHPFVVEIIGGEPLEPPALGVTISLLRELDDHPKCAGTVVSTAVASPFILDRILPSVARIYLSVDVSASRANRKVLSTSRLASVARRCRAYDVDLFLSTVLFGDETSESLERFVRDAADAGVNHVGFSHQTATPLDSDAIQVAIGQYYELFRLRLMYSGRIAVVGTILDSVELSVVGGRRTASCECGSKSIVIEPDGALVPGLCADHRDARVSVHDFRAVRSERNVALLGGACGSCSLWPVCQGGCAFEGMRTNGSLLERDETQCRVMLGVTERVARDIAKVRAT